MRDLELVRQLARATAATTDVDRVLRIALEVVCDHMGARVGTLWQPDVGSSWRPQHHYGAGPHTSQLPPVARSMVATATPSSLWRGEHGRPAAAAIVGTAERPVAILHVELDAAEGAQALLALCETAAELVTRVVQRATAQAQLLEAQQLARMGTWQWDVVADEVVWSGELFASLGLEPAVSQSAPAAFLELVRREDRQAVRDAAVRAVADLEPFEVAFGTTGDGGHARWLLARGQAVAGPDGRATRVAGTLQDVTERRQLEEELAHRATHDQLTGLANRSAFQQQLERLQTAQPSGSVVGVLDVDRFGAVTAKLGGPAGDALLRGIAERLKQRLGPEVVARLAGDEFAVAASAGRIDAEGLGDCLLAVFDEPFHVESGLQQLAASVGVAASRTGGESADELMRDAAHAVELAKTRGGGRMQVFDPDQNAQTLEVQALEADLRHAVDHGDLAVVYQPVVDLATGAVVSTEALVRWQRSGHGSVSPAEFVPMAERLGLVGRLGSQVLLAACGQLAAWRREFPDAAELSMAVNLSAGQLDDPTIVATVEEALQRTGLAASDLTLEVTESALPDDAAGVLTRLWELRNLGVRIAIDDFGTGYSTLSRLRELPVDVLKIDRSFFADTSRDAPILQALFAMARTLELGTVAEGIETPAQLRAVLANDGGHVQGYLFSRPLTAEGIGRLLEDPQWDAAEVPASDPSEIRPDAADGGHLAQSVERFVAAADADEQDRTLRELLAAVAAATGMDSVYLTRVDLVDQQQHLEVVADPGTLGIHEGASTPWPDTLCRQALLADRQLIVDVPSEHPDVAAAADLGIHTFMVAPVRSRSGGLHGTLCAAAGDHREVPPAAIDLLSRVAGLVASRLADDEVSTKPAR